MKMVCSTDRLSKYLSGRRTNQMENGAAHMFGGVICGGQLMPDTTHIIRKSNDEEMVYKTILIPAPGSPNAPSVPSDSSSLLSVTTRS